MFSCSKALPRFFVGFLLCTENKTIQCMLGCQMNQSDACEVDERKCQVNQSDACEVDERKCQVNRSDACEVDEMNYQVNQSDLAALFPPGYKNFFVQFYQIDFLVVESVCEQCCSSYTTTRVLARILILGRKLYKVLPCGRGVLGASL